MKKYLSPLLLTLAALIWGIAFVAQKAAAEIPAFTLLAARSIIATLVLVPIVVLFDKLKKSGRSLFSVGGSALTKKELIGGIVSGVFLFIASALQQVGIAGTDVGKASFITALYVLIVPIYALIFGKKSPLSTWIGVIISIVGFYLLCIKEDLSIMPADLLVLLCAVVFAIQIMSIDHFSKDSDGVRLSLVQFFTVTVISTVAALIFESPISFSAIGAVMPEILYLGIGSSGIAYTLQILGQKNTHPAVASIILSLESVIGAIASAIILGERMSAREYVGAAIVFVAVVISQIDMKALFSKLGKQNSAD